MVEWALGFGRLTALQGDITVQRVDAIVNAANSGLLGGGGVDGAIHRAGGPTILDECRRIRERDGRCKTGHAVITGGGNLAARWVIHAVGPVWSGGGNGEPELLRSAYLRSIALAREAGAKTLAFPAISTGAYGYPAEPAAQIAITTCREAMHEQPVIDEIRFVLFSEEAYSFYRRIFETSCRRSDVR